MRTARITSFGYGHSDPSGRLLLPPAAHITADLRAHFRDAHAAAWLRGLTAADPGVRAFVLATPGIRELISALTAAVCAYHRGGPEPVSVAIGCTGGRHRAPAVASELADVLYGMGVHVDLAHRDIGRPVLARGRHG